MATDRLVPQPSLGAALAITQQAGRLLAIGYLAICAGLAVIAFAPLCAGWRATVVAGDSMRPALRPGDVLVYQRPTPERLITGRIVITRDRSQPDGLLAHRLAGFAANGDLRTKGDANEAKDSTPVPPDAVLGAARLVVPYVGLPTLWREHDRGRLALWAGSLTLAGYLALRAARHRPPIRT